MQELRSLPPRNLVQESRKLLADQTEVLSEEFRTPRNYPSSSAATVSQRPSWPTLPRPLHYWAIWLLLLTGTIALFWTILPVLWRTWLDDPNHAHGILAPLVSAALIWGSRRALQDTEIRPSVWGFLLAGLAILLYLAALRTHLALPARMALLLTITGFIWGNFGAQTLKIVRFPLFFLAFMIPIPDTVLGLVAFPLQRFASTIAAYLLDLGGFPVLREGTMLYFPNASLEVAEACSGLRSMGSYAFLGVLFAYLGRDRLGALQRLLLIAVTMPLALAINILRVAGTGVLATYIGSRAAQGFLHEFSGFVVFALGFLLLWGLSGLLSRARRRAAGAAQHGFLAHPEGV